MGMYFYMQKMNMDIRNCHVTGHVTKMTLFRFLLYNGLMVLNKGIFISEISADDE